MDLLQKNFEKMCLRFGKIYDLASIIRFVFHYNNDPDLNGQAPASKEFDRHIGCLHKLKKNMVFVDKPFNRSSHSYQIAKWNLYRFVFLDFCALIQVYPELSAWIYVDPIYHQLPSPCYQLSTPCLWRWNNTFHTFFYSCLKSEFDRFDKVTLLAHLKKNDLQSAAN